MNYKQGSEMKHHKPLTEDNGVTVYFRSPLLSVGARVQLKHQRPTPPVPAQKTRSIGVLSGSRPTRPGTSGLSEEQIARDGSE